MRFAFITPRIALQKDDFLGSGVPYWPIEIATIAAFLREKGNTVSVFDLFGQRPHHLEDKGSHFMQGRPFGEVVNAKAIAEADIVILFALSYMSHGELLGIAAEARARYPRKRVFVLENSQAVTSYSIPRKASEFFGAGVDGLLCGNLFGNWEEVERALYDPAALPPENILLAGNSSERLVKRKSYRYQSLPVPAWDLFPLENYWALPYSHGPKTRRFLPILTSRGCPFPCDFCVIPEINDTRWMGRDPEEVVAEILTLKERFNVKHFQVEDVNPTVNFARWSEICRLLIEKKAAIFFYFVSGTKAETVKLEQIATFAEAGLRYLSISPESGSKAVLKEIRKPFDHAYGLKLVEACRAHGIYVQACFIVGHPAEKDEDHRKSCDYLRALVKAGVDEVAIFIVAPFPGSRLQAEGAIPLRKMTAFTSFSPIGRTDWDVLQSRRTELIRIFFVEKLKRGAPLFLQGIRALLRIPRTKMENLPWRILYVRHLLLRNRFTKVQLTNQKRADSENKKAVGS